MTSPSSRQQLLLVDDEEDALLELAELLEGEGFCCFTATSVKLALDHLTRHPDIALVITDPVSYTHLTLPTIYSV